MLLSPLKIAPKRRRSGKKNRVKGRDFDINVCDFLEKVSDFHHHHLPLPIPERLEEEELKMSLEENNNLIEILEEGHKVDIVKYIDYVSAPQAGAIATFSGTTRDTFQGKTVLELRYEAYVPMATRYLSYICADARSNWDIHKIAVAHRLGPVPVGETSVFVAVSSVHRGDGLDACKFLIDELKASVPIWKKEVYANGEVWKENREFLEKRLELAEKRLENAESLVKKRVAGEHRRSCCGSKVRVQEDEEHRDIA